MSANTIVMGQPFHRERVEDREGLARGAAQIIEIVKPFCNPDVDISAVNAAVAPQGWSATFAEEPNHKSGNASIVFQRGATETNREKITFDYYPAGRGYQPASLTVRREIVTEMGTRTSLCKLWTSGACKLRTLGRDGERSIYSNSRAFYPDVAASAIDIAETALRDLGFITQEQVVA